MIARYILEVEDTRLGDPVAKTVNSLGNKICQTLVHNAGNRAGYPIVRAKVEPYDEPVETPEQPAIRKRNLQKASDLLVEAKAGLEAAEKIVWELTDWS